MTDRQRVLQCKTYEEYKAIQREVTINPLDKEVVDHVESLDHEPAFAPKGMHTELRIDPEKDAWPEEWD